MAAVIVAAAAAGAGVTAAAVRDFASPAAGTGSGPPAANPGNGVIGGGTSPGGVLPGGGPGGGAGPGGGTGSGGSIFLVGTVTAVSRTSITISGPGHTITATVTTATHVTGKVAGIGGIKAGDHVSAQLTAGNGRIVAVTIADPPQVPGGGSLP